MDETRAALWSRLIGWTAAHGQQSLLVAIKELNLGPAQARMLQLLEPGVPQTMGALKDSFGCDASNITGLVGRMEKLGLLKHEACLDDRRVKWISLTESGEQMRAELLAIADSYPAAFASLTDEHLAMLDEVLVHLEGKTCDAIAVSVETDVVEMA